MAILLPVLYFPPIDYFAHWVQNEQVTLELNENFIKQTYRNRSYIYGANGKLMLNIPTRTKNNSRLYANIAISYDENWMAQHWKSLVSAYKTSPYFEYYQDDLELLFKQKDLKLQEFNLKALELVLECLQLDYTPRFTTEFQAEVKDKKDLRKAFNAKGETLEIESYDQVFQEKHGFISNLSILDLLFNEGPNSINYLKQIKLL